MVTVTPLFLQSARLLLRRWGDADLEYLAGLSADPAVIEHLLPVDGRRASDALAQRIRDHFVAHDFGFWAVEIPHVCPFIGFVGLAHVGYEARFTPAIEIGWRFGTAHWGRGYATEAASVALADGFQRLKLPEVVAATVPANHRSRRVMERLGMRRTESDDFDHPHVPDGHPLRRHVLYRLKRNDWTTNRPNG